MAVKSLLKELIFYVLIYLLSVMTVSLLHNNNLLLTIALVSISIIMFLVWRDKRDVFCFIVGFIAGPLGEVIAISFGTWVYTNPTVFGIPLWLPVLWGLAMVSLNRVSLLVIKVKKEYFINRKV